MNIYETRTHFHVRSSMGLFSYTIAGLHHHVILQQRRHLHQQPFDQQLFQRVSAPQAVFEHKNFNIWLNVICQNDDFTSKNKKKYLCLRTYTFYNIYTFSLLVKQIFNLFIALGNNCMYVIIIDLNYSFNVKHLPRLLN